MKRYPLTAPVGHIGDIALRTFRPDGDLWDRIANGEDGCLLDPDALTPDLMDVRAGWITIADVEYVAVIDRPANAVWVQS